MEKGITVEEMINKNELTVDVRKVKMTSGLSCLMLFKIWLLNE